MWVAAVSLLVTAFTWALADEFIKNRDEVRFNNSVNNAHLRLEDRMARTVNLLRTTRGMVIVGEDLDRAKFKLYVDSIVLEENYRGLLGLGLSMKIEPKDVARIEKRMRTKEGVPRFQIRPKTKDINAIVMLQPETAENLAALGYNMMSEPVRREAMLRAGKSGMPALTGKVNLVQDKDSGTPGFLLYFPFYGTRVTPKTDAEREKHLAGFAYIPFRAPDLFSAIFKDLPESFVKLYIYDGLAPKSETLLYTSPEVESPSSNWHRERSLPFAGHTWTVRYRSTQAFDRASGGAVLLLIPIAGLAVTLLLAWLSWRQTRAAQILAEQAVELKRREFHQRMLAETGTLLNNSLDYEATLASVAQMSVPSFADWCSVDVLDPDGKVRRLAVAHVNPDKVAWAHELQDKYPPDANATTGVPNVLRTGNPELYEVIPQEMLRAAAKDEEMWRIIESLGFTSAMIVPMNARGRTLGALSYVWAESGKHYDKEDLQLAVEVANRAAIAMDNALLYEEAQRERVEVSRLNENLERMVRERTSDLESAVNELEAFSYSVSHDLRAPLRGVDGFSKTLLDDYGDVLDDSAKEYIQKIRAAAKRMDELIAALLSLSRITRAEMTMRPVDISQIAQEAAEDALEGIEQTVDVRIAEGLRGTADPRMLPIVFDNLISNAIKFSLKGDHPIVEVGRQGDAFFVRDNGVGFNPEYANKLFAPFERLHSVKDFPGSGIGLATVERIIHRHGGRIWAESKEGEGAIFFFTLG
ncbi:MAG: CHASE domain-containing protein [Fimbriimonas sp.]